MKTTININRILIILMLSAISFLVNGCDFYAIPGNGNVVRQDRPVGPFTKVDVSGAFDIVIKQGASESLSVETDENLQKMVRTEVMGSTLKIDTREPIRNPTKMKVYITIRDMKELEISGAVDVETDGRLTLDGFRIFASGATDTRMDLTVKELELDCSGGSKLHFSGTAGSVDVSGSGAMDLFAYDLVAENYDLSISGAGKAEIQVTKKLRAEISGAGTVRYKGSPGEIAQDVSGAGSIRKAE